MSGNQVSLLLAGTLLMSSCALHTPERATIRFIHELNSGVARLEGSAAFERARMGLHLEERRPREASNPVFRRSAAWSRQNKRIALVSSNVLRDPPERFDLRLSWSPHRRLRPDLLEGLLGTPYGLSATWNNGWVIDGGILEYRSTEIETPYLLFSSPGYVRGPLDFLEAANLPHLPTLESVNDYLERNASVRMPSRAEDTGLESKRSCTPRGVCITVYSGLGPQGIGYLAGLAISLPGKNSPSASAADFLPVLHGLGIQDSHQVVAVIFGARIVTAPHEIGYYSFAVYSNFALALSHSADSDPLETSIWIWRRIESPRLWCKHLRPDLERCSETADR